MSLKAKIEAVIYASEDPVTLAQLTGLLGQEAQAELDYLESAQQSLALEGELSPQIGSQTESDIALATESAPLPEADIEGAPAAEAEIDPTSSGDSGPEPTGSEPPGPEPPEPAPTEPQPTETAPDHAPEPTEESPLPEHPQPAPSAPDAKSDLKSAKQDEKARDRRLREYFRSILGELIADYAASERGLEIREVASGYRLATKPEYHDAVRGFVKSIKPPLKLSLQALETLAVVAYKQPITAPEISEIRGVDSGGVLGSLMARKLITTAGRKQVIGRPILYKTTRDFLLRFGLKDIAELPSIEEFEKMASELADSFAEPVAYPMQEEIRMSQTAEPPNDLEDEKNEVQPQADGDSIPLAATSESTAGVPGTTVATPEGDNEFAPDQPLSPIQ